MEQIKEWYNGLEENEQKIVVFAGVFFSVVILFFGLIKPVNDKVSKLGMSVKTKQETIAQWRKDLPKIMSSRGQVSSSGSQKLSSVVTSSTRRFNLRVSRVQEKGVNEIQVWFDNVPFNDFARWVADLNNRYKVSVASVNVRSKDRNGISSIDVKLTKS